MIIAYLIVFLTLIFTFLYLGYIIYLQFLPGAFYYPSVTKDIDTIFKSINLSRKQTFIDLGSGDGRIIIAAAQHGFNSIGYELDPILVQRSRQKIKKLNLSHLASIKAKNFWKADIENADIIYFYQFPKYTLKLEKIFQKVNHPITVISNSYPLPHQKPYLVKDKLYFYKFP
jgi:16S rRNA A1518/A1519 N6-dimethyltransferase RsmA/KsgA/DIM1 with predicted DNA glycosylase/AP lyase activity